MTLSTKRPRIDIDESETEELQDVVQSTSLWLEDGNIILHVGETRFRVHRSVLQLHSKILGGMLDKSKLQGTPIIDGCHVVKLDDSARDVEHFLNGLYNRRLHYKDALPLDVFEAFLRLGHKYAVHHLRDEAMACLAFECPTTLEEWDDVVGGFTKLDLSGHCYGLSRIFVLTEEFNLHRHAPALTLILASTKTLATLLDNPRDIFTKEHVLQIALAAEQFREARRGMTFSWLDNLPCSTCTTRSVCASVRRKVFMANFEDDYEFPVDVNPIVPWDHTICEQFCSECESSARSQHESNRSEIWENLPAYCGLPDWEDLTNFEPCVRRYPANLLSKK